MSGCTGRTGLGRDISRLTAISCVPRGALLDSFKTKISSSYPLSSPLLAIRPGPNVHSLLSLSISSAISIFLSFVCLLTPCARSIQSLLVLAWSTRRFSPSRIKDMLIAFFHRLSHSSLETSLQRSATYEHELKDLEVHNLIRHISHIIDPSLTISKGKAPRRPQQLSGVRGYHP